MTALKHQGATKTHWAAVIGAAAGFFAMGHCQAMPAWPVFFGLSSGVSNVNWSAMIKHDLGDPSYIGHMDSDNPAKAGGTGMSTGAFIGLRLTEYFAIQADYIHYPTTSVLFKSETTDPDDNKTIANNYTASGKSSIDCWDIELRPSIHLWREKLTSFALVGLNLMQRSDPWAQAKYPDANRPTPPPVTNDYTNYNLGGTFGLGLDYNFDIPLSIEAGFTYTTGQARAAAAPMYYYFPFLYRSYVSILYHF